MRSCQRFSNSYATSKDSRVKYLVIESFPPRAKCNVFMHLKHGIERNMSLRCHPGALAPHTPALLPHPTHTVSPCCDVNVSQMRPAGTPPAGVLLPSAWIKGRPALPFCECTADVMCGGATSQLSIRGPCLKSPLNIHCGGVLRSVCNSCRTCVCTRA